MQNPPEKAAAAEPVYFNVMIPKWAKHYDKGKKCRQDMETKCGVFIEWLRRSTPSGRTKTTWRR